MIFKKTAMQAYRDLCKRGQLEGARVVLRGMIRGSYQLRVNDADWEAEKALARLGATFAFSRSGEVGHCRVVRA